MERFSSGALPAAKVGERSKVFKNFDPEGLLDSDIYRNELVFKFDK